MRVRKKYIASESMALDCGFTSPPEIENQDADCRINICIDNSIYGIAALPYPVRCPEKAPREMADVVFGQKDDWQEDEDEVRFEKEVRRCFLEFERTDTQAGGSCSNRVG